MTDAEGVAMTLDEMRQIVGELAVLFDIPAPTITWSSGKGGYYHGAFHTIYIPRGQGGAGLLGDMRWALLHEFAHAVTRSKSGPGHGHDEVFCGWLLKTIRKRGHRVTTYAWHRDYVKVHAWAVRKGLSTKRHVLQEREDARRERAAARGVDIRVGERVAFLDDRGRTIVGTVMTARRRARVRVAVAGYIEYGRVWRVPVDGLKPAR